MTAQQPSPGRRHLDLRDRGGRDDSGRTTRYHIVLPSPAGFAVAPPWPRPILEKPDPDAPRCLFSPSILLKKIGGVQIDHVVARADCWQKGAPNTGASPGGPRSPTSRSTCSPPATPSTSPKATATPQPGCRRTGRI